MNPAMLAPSVRIQRRTGGQRRWADRARESAESLRLHSRIRDEALARAALEPRLARLGDALLRSPYHARTLRRAGFSPRDLRSLDDIRHFPLLDRETLRRRWAELPALDPADRDLELVAVQSSGSTGRPVTLLKDPYDCVHMWAVLAFWTGWLGVTLPPRPRVVLLCSLSGGIEYSVRLPLVDDGALHRISLVRPRALERLLRARPAVLFADPDGLHWLESRDGLPRPRIVLSSAQYLAPEQRSRAAAALHAPVVNYYASTDTGPIAWECLLSHGRFHTLVPDVWVESVAGELVVTRLRPSVLPLLRYRTGDRGEISPDACPCGYHGWSITRFTGRRQCTFLTPDGREADAWKLAWLFKHYPLHSFRLTQRGAEEFELQLVPERGIVDVGDLRDRLETALGRLGWARASVAPAVVAAIPCTGEKPDPFRRTWRALPA